VSLLEDLEAETPKKLCKAARVAELLNDEDRATFDLWLEHRREKPGSALALKTVKAMRAAMAKNGAKVSEDVLRKHSICSCCCFDEV